MINSGKKVDSPLILSTVSSSDLFRGSRDSRNKCENDELEDLLDHLYTLHGKEIDLGLDRLISLLDKLGNPHLKIPSTIHVAGTNGKGSTIAFCRSILEAANHKVHVYTSPHLVKFNERIRLNGQLAQDNQLYETLQEILRINDSQPITFFEITTAAAFLLFSRISSDFVLLETGLGGRLDATNVIDSPLASIITPISYDHQEFLGDTLQKIAFEKAGIIKSGCPVIVGPQPKEVIRVIKEQATLKRSPLYLYEEDWDLDILLSYPEPALKGDHQRINAATAIKTIQTVTSVNSETIATGLASATWPGRLQLLQKDPFEIWLDGAHNPAGGEILAHEIKKWGQDVAVVGIIGMKKRKDALEVLRIIKPVLKKTYMVPVDENGKTGPSHSPKELCEMAASIGLPSDQALDYGHALRLAQNDHPLCKCVIMGSLYLIGEVLKDLLR